MGIGEIDRSLSGKWLALAEAFRAVRIGGGREDEPGVGVSGGLMGSRVRLVGVSGPGRVTVEGQDGSKGAGRCLGARWSRDESFTALLELAFPFTRDESRRGANGVGPLMSLELVLGCRLDRFERSREGFGRGDGCADK